MTRGGAETEGGGEGTEGGAERATRGGEETEGGAERVTRGGEETEGGGAETEGGAERVITTALLQCKLSTVIDSWLMLLTTSFFTLTQLFLT